MNPQDYVAAHQHKLLDELLALLTMPSVSTLPEHCADVRQTAEWLMEQLIAIGFAARIYETPGHPIVYGEWLQAAPESPTVLIYGHYDVQPVDPLEEWHTPPFEPTLQDGKVYARGASDDKGQTFIHIKAAQAILATEGKLPVNVKFIIEGEEEIGSRNLKAFIGEHTDLLAADVVLVSDTHVKSLDEPTIIYTLRGTCSMELEVTGPRQDLHSGTYGGMVHNPAQALCEIMAQLHDTKGTITVPGFYDRVRPLEKAERDILMQQPYTEADLVAETGVSVPWGEPEFRLHERTGARPTLEINGLVSGWTGAGGKTIVPAKALAKISCRLVADQDPAEIYELVKAYIAQITPPTVTSELRLRSMGNSVIADRNSPPMQAAIAAYEEGWGATPAFAREGGSIPVVAELQRHLDVPVILMGFGLPDDNLHAPNEKLTLECYWRGIATSISFMQHVTH